MAAMLVEFGMYWCWAGSAVAILFLIWGVDRIDENARGAYIFRPLLFPGVVLLWPLVLWRWILLERNALNALDRHYPPRKLQAALELSLAIGVPLILFAGFFLSQGENSYTPPLQIEPPAVVSEALGEGR